MRKSVLKAISIFVLTIMLTNGTFSYQVLANQIIIDHKTQTHVEQVGNITNISTTTRTGANALNSFSRFDISSGNIVNLFVPDDAKNLLNLVHSHRSEIHGTLNSIAQGKIGGNVYFLNPHGFLVGEHGTINVGSLTLLTPTTAYMNEFFTPTGVNDTLLNQAISGNVPIGNTGLISVKGKVNALDGISLQAAGVSISGELQTGAIFEHNLDFSNVVNIRDWEAGGAVVSEGGTIRIVAPQIEGSGTLRTDGELTMEATSSNAYTDGQALIAWQGGFLQADNITFSAESSFSDQRQLFSNVDSSAVIQLDSVTLNASGNLELRAISLVDVETVNPDLKIGVLPVDAAAAITIVDSQAEVKVTGSSNIQVSGTLTMVADNQVHVVSQADASTEEDIVGASVAVSKVNTRTVAVVEGSSTIEAGSLGVSASSENRLETTAVAAVKGASEDNDSSSEGYQQKYLDEYSEQAQTSEGSVGIAGALAISDLQTETKASLESSGTIKVTGRADVSSEEYNEAVVVADGSTVDTESVGVGVAVGINLVDASNQAIVAQKLEATSLNISAQTKGREQSHFETEAISGAGSTNVGVAGSLGVNVIDNNTEALLSADLVLAGDLELAAEGRLDSTVKSTPSDKGASAETVGVGASVAVNTLTEQVKSEVGEGVSLTGVANLGVYSSLDSSTTTEAKAGAAGGIAIDAAVAVTTLDQSSQAIIAKGSELATSGQIEVTSSSTGSHSATATGDTESANVGIGAAVAVISSNSAVEGGQRVAGKNPVALSVIDRDLDAGGDILVSAFAQRSYETEASAGAKGAQEDEDKSGKSTSGKTLSENEASQEGTEDGGTIKVAAAVAVSYINDDVIAQITGESESDRRMISSGGDLTVSAQNDSNFSSKGSGEAVDEDTAVGIAVGVGLSILRNDTIASVGPYATINTAGDLQVSAESNQNREPEYLNKLGAEAISGAGADKVGVAGSLAVVESKTTTQAFLDEKVIVEDAGNLTISADNTSKLAAKAWSKSKANQAGIGASVATIVSRNEYKALLGAGSNVQNSKNLIVAARNHKVSGDVPFQFSDYESLNLQVILGENNYYTEALAGAGGKNVAVTGAFAVNVFDDSTEALVGSGSTINSGNVELVAENSTTAKAFAGGVTGSSKTGVGLSSATMVNESETRSLLQENVTVRAQQMVVDAFADQDLGTFGASAAAAGNLGISGVATVIVSDNAVEAGVARDSDLTLTEDLDVKASNEIKVLNISGSAAGGKTAGIGASSATTVIENNTRAYLGQKVQVEALGSTRIAALANESLKTIAAGGAGGGKAGVAGSAVVNTLDTSTNAFIDLGAKINLSYLTTNGGQNVSVIATDQTDIVSVAGAAAFGGKAGVGAAADVGVISKDTHAFIASSASEKSQVYAGNTVAVLADSEEKITSVAAGAAGGGYAGVAGTAVVYTIDNSTLAQIGDHATVRTGGNLIVSAVNNNKLVTVSGSIAASGVAGVGGSGSVIVSNRRTEASVGNNTLLNALGLHGAATVYNGKFTVDYQEVADEEGKVPRPDYAASDLTGDGTEDEINNESLKKERVASEDQQEIRGLAIIAVSQDHLEQAAVGGAVSSSVSVTGAGAVSLINNETRAFMGDNVQAESDAEILVASGSDFYNLAIGGALAGSGGTSVGPGTHVSVVALDTTASLGANSIVRSKEDITVQANSSEDILSIAAAGSAGASIGISGAVTVNSLENRTQAWIGNGAQVSSDKSLHLLAQDLTESTRIAGGLGLGISAAGVGGSVDVSLIDKDTRAYIGSDAQVDAKENLNVQAESKEELLNVVASGGFGLLAGAAGAVSFNSVNSKTAAYIATNARINQAISGASNQSINISAKNRVNLLSIAGSMAGGTLGASGGVGIGVIKNDVVAFTGDGVKLKAVDSIDLDAVSTQEIESYAISAGAGVVGVAGGVSLITIGSDLDFDSKTVDGKSASSVLSTSDGKDDVQSYISGQISGNVGATLLDGYEDPNTQNALGELNQRTDSVSGQFSDAFLGDKSVGKTQAYLGESNEVDTKNLNVDATTELEITQVTGGAAAGKVGLGGGVSITTLNTNTEAFVGANTVIGSSGKVAVNAELDQTYEGYTVAGSGGYVSALAGSLTYLDDHGRVSSSLGNNLSISAGSMDLTAEAQRDLSMLGVGASATLMGPALSGTVLIAKVDGETEAIIGQGATFESSGNISVEATSESLLTGEGWAPAVGSFAGLGAAVTVLEDRSAVMAIIEDGAKVRQADTFQVVASSNPRVHGETWGGGAGIVAAGASVTDVNVSGSVTALVGNGVEIGQHPSQKVSNVIVRAEFGPAGETAKAVTHGGAAGLVAGAGSDAKAVVNPKIIALIGNSAKVKALNNIHVMARSQSSASALSKGLNIAGLGVGLSFAEAELTPVITATIGNSGTIEAGAVQISALHNYTEDGTVLAAGVEATAYSATGALIGGSGAEAEANGAAEVVSTIGSSTVKSEDKVEVISRSNNTSHAEADGQAYGGIAAGAVLAESRTSGTTRASLNGGITAGHLAIVADSTDRVSALTKAGAGGIAAGSGSIAKATADSETTSYTGSSLNLAVIGGAVSILADANTQVQAEAKGVNAGGLAVGVSEAIARNLPTVRAYLGNSSSVFARDFTIQARALVPKTSSNAIASGGGLVGVNATVSEAASSVVVDSFIGSNSRINLTGGLNVVSEGNTSQEATSTAVTGGVVAVGSNRSVASSNSRTNAYLAAGVELIGQRTAVEASGADNNYASAIAGTGGVVTGTAASAVTVSTGTTSAWVGNAAHLNATNFDLKATHRVNFNAHTDSTNAGLVGASGAQTTNQVEHNLRVAVGDASTISAENLAIFAHNQVSKERLSEGRYNVQSGSGGAVDAAAAKSSTTIGIDTQIELGKNTLLAVIGDRTEPGVLVIEGLNDIRAFDNVKLDAGAAISVPQAESAIRNDRNNLVLAIGKGAELTSAGDIDLAVWNKTDIRTVTNVKTYGGAGAAQGYSLARSQIRSSINVGEDVNMLALGDSNLRVGSNRLGNVGSQTITANTDLWNKTVLPIETKPDADATLDQVNSIVLSPGSHLKSAGHLRLLTDGGTRNVHGYGVGKDLYRQALQEIGQFFSDLFGGGDVSLEVKAGRSTDNLTSSVQVDGKAEVGIENKRYLVIGVDGKVDEEHSSEGYTVTETTENLSNSIQDRLNELNLLIQALKDKVGEQRSNTQNPEIAREIDDLTKEHTDSLEIAQELQNDITDYQSQNTEKNQQIAANNANIEAWEAQLKDLDPVTNADQIEELQGLIDNAISSNVNLLNEINFNNDVIKTYQDSIDSLVIRIAEIHNRLELLNTMNIPSTGPGIGGLLERYQAEKAMLEAQLASMGGHNTAQVLSVDQEIVARSSNIYVRADNLIGSGSLLAPGDTLIEVLNKSDCYLRTNKMTIPDEAGGRIFFNQVSVASVEDINSRNKNANANFANADIVTAENTTAEIRVINSFIPYGSERAPDLFVDGEVRNLGGKVQLTSTFGSVQVKDGVDIIADTIEITAGRDITIGYKDGFRNIGGDIHKDWKKIIEDAEKAKRDYSTKKSVEELLGLTEPSRPSLLAGNNIFVSGQYLNINGVIQSGLPERTLVIPESLAAEIAAYKQRFDQGLETDRIFKGLTINDGIASDISKVAVFYDAVDNTLELVPIFTMGGYMELYGHIMNTGTGELKVMDGYSRIQIDNQTGYALRLKDINTGNGIEGTIKITDTGQRAANGNPLQTVIKRQGSTIYTYSNAADGTLNLVNAVAQNDGRTTAYQPAANQYYSWTVKDERSWTEKRTEYFERWFGIKGKTKTSYSGITSYNEQKQIPVGAAVLRVVEGKTDTYWYDRTLYLTEGAWINGNWKEVENVIYVYIKEERSNTRNMREVVFHNHNIAAFHPIKIEFLGYDQGIIDVRSVGDITIDGTLRNNTGTITLQSTGAIRQTDNALAQVIGQELSFDAKRGIGNQLQAVGVQLVNAGKVTAQTETGDLHLTATRGSLDFVTISAEDGSVYLGADTGIFGRGASSLISGNLVNLQVDHGTVGAKDNYLRIDSKSGGLEVEAAGDIHLTEISGDLYVNQVESLGGDVFIKTENGSILDNNKNEVRDTRLEAELLGMWSAMGLTGEQARESALHSVEAYERMKTREYADYWQLRARLDESDYDPSAKIRLTDDEINYYETTLGWTSQEIQSYEDKLTNDLHTLHQVYEAVSDEYDPFWTYVVAKPLGSDGKPIFEGFDSGIYDEWNTLIAGFSWTEDQLKNSMGVGVLKETSDTRVRIEEPNVVGRNVTLESSKNIGQSNPVSSIKLNGRTWTQLTDEERLLILTAENKDLEIVSDDEILIASHEDLNLTATGTISASADGDLFLGSEETLTIRQITAAGEIRLKSRGSIFSGAEEDQVAIVGEQLLLEAARGSIGEQDKAILINTGDFTARSGQDIYLKSNSDLNIDTIYAIGHVDLRSNGAILNSTNPNQNIRAESLNLIAETIGTSSHFLKIGLDATGTVTAHANGNIYLESPIRTLNTNSITSGGDIYIFGGDSINVGSTAGGIETQFGRVTIDSRGSILSLDRGDKAGITAQDIRLETATGSIGSQENDLRINILSQGIFAADAERGIYVDAVRGDFHVANASSAGGNIRLTASEGNMIVDATNAFGDMDLAAQGNMTLDTVDAGNNMSFAAQGDLVVSEASAQGAMTLDAGGKVVIERVMAEQGTVSVSAGDNILGQGEQTKITANNIALKAETGRIGDPESLLKINSSDSGAVTAQAKLGIYLHEVDGVLNIVSAHSEQGDVHIVADDSILGGNLSGDDITLRSRHSSIGESGGHLITEARGILNAHAQGSIFLTQQGGDLNSEQMWAEEGSIELNVTSGQTQITALTAGNGVAVTSSGNIAIGRVIALDGALLATGVDQSIQVNEALVRRSLSAHADQVYLSWVDHTGPDQLKMAIGGGSKKLANTVYANVESEPGIIFSKLHAVDLEVTGNTDDLSFHNTIVGSKATFRNKYYTVVADNVEKKLYTSVELQLFPDDKPFFLIMGEHRRMFTDADIVNYSNHFIINDFHTTNSFIRAATKLVELAGTRTQERSQSSFGDRGGLVHTNDSQVEDEEGRIDLPEILQMGSAI